MPIHWLQMHCKRKKHLVLSNLANDHTEARVYFNHDAFWLKATSGMRRPLMRSIANLFVQQFPLHKVGSVHPFNLLDWLPLHLLHLHFSLCFISTYPQDFFQIVSKTHSPCLSKTDVQPLQFLAKFPSSFSSSPFVYLACIAPYRFCQDCLPWNYGHPQSEAATMHDKDFKIHVAVVLI